MTHPLAVASEAKVFFKHPDIEIGPDFTAFPSYFIHGYVPCPGTLYRDSCRSGLDKSRPWPQRRGLTRVNSLVDPIGLRYYPAAFARAE